MATAKKKQSEEVKLSARLNRLTSGLTLSEGGSVSISVGNVREILRVLAKAHAEHVFTGGGVDDAPLVLIHDYAKAIFNKMSAAELNRSKKASQPKEPVQAQKKKPKTVSKKKKSK